MGEGDEYADINNTIKKTKTTMCRIEFFMIQPLRISNSAFTSQVTSQVTSQGYEYLYAYILLATSLCIPPSCSNNNKCYGSACLLCLFVFVCVICRLGCVFPRARPKMMIELQLISFCGDIHSSSMTSYEERRQVTQRLRQYMF